MGVRNTAENAQRSQKTKYTLKKVDGFFNKAWLKGPSVGLLRLKNIKSTLLLKGVSKYERGAPNPSGHKRFAPNGNALRGSGSEEGLSKLSAKGFSDRAPALTKGDYFYDRSFSLTHNATIFDPLFSLNLQDAYLGPDAPRIGATIKSRVVKVSSNKDSVKSVNLLGRSERGKLESTDFTNNHLAIIPIRSRQTLLPHKSRNVSLYAKGSFKRSILNASTQHTLNIKRNPYDG